MCCFKIKLRSLFLNFSSMDFLHNPSHFDKYVYTWVDILYFGFFFGEGFYLSIRHIIVIFCINKLFFRVF